MIQKRRVFINALVSALQVVVIGGTFFVLYRFLRDSLGDDDFGVWALVLATTSAGSIANLGLAASAVKFVSQYLARGDHPHVARIVQTAALSVGLFLGVMLLILYPFLGKLLAVFIEPADKLPEALSILPYALVSFWLTSVAGVFQSCLDGFHRVDLRGMLLMVAALVYLGLAFLLVPDGGLIGIAEAQVAQAGLLFVVSWGMLKRLMPGLPWLPFRWHQGTFKEMLSYSLNFQVISLTQLFLEPAVKSFISKFGGVSTLTNFEFAYRMVFQVRALLATAHQAIVPTIADLKERDPDRIREVYVASYRLLLFLVIPLIGFLIALTPVISQLWIGYYEPDFVLFSVLLMGAWAVNLTSNPAYFANMGTGELRWNVIGHVVMGILSGGLGVLLGWQFGGLGVVIGFCTALIIGSLTTAISYQHIYRIRMVDLIQRETGWLFVASVAGAALSLLLYCRLAETWGSLSLGLMVLAIYAILVLLPLWKHPIREQVQSWVVTLLLPSRTPSPES